MPPSLIKTPSQAERRRGVVALDQHGRKWENVIEISTGEPCSSWMPQFNAPWFPPPTAVKRDPMNNARLVIDYPMILRRAKVAHADYAMSLRAYAQRMPGVIDVEAVVKTPPPLLLDVVGPGPEPRQFAYAASVGNRWVLGFDAEAPEWAKALMPPESEGLAAEFPEIRGGPEAVVQQRTTQFEQLSAEDEAELAAMGAASGIEGDDEGDDEGSDNPPRAADGKFTRRKAIA